MLVKKIIHMKKINHVVLVLVLSCFCILQAQVTSAQEPKITVNSIFSENIISIIDLLLIMRSYNQEMSLYISYL